MSNVIFDFCGVLLDWRPQLTLEGQYPQGVIDMFFDPADPRGFDYYDRKSDEGWSQERILKEYEESHGPAVAWVFRTYFEHFQQSLHGMMPGMSTLLKELDAMGIHMWGLTNFTTEYVDAVREHFPEFALLRDIVISSEVSLAKPDPRIYKLAAQRFGVDIHSCIFVDDTQENVDAAQTIGMQAIHFTDAASLRAHLLSALQI
ncbi:HAD family hydrolase [Bifidobacterium sp.]|jgi:2-haloacid dehalogenase|uniref:HAD family hydrolase n=1 Tax=Bifidobacterium sp. TaxID=41200 RepID=UPI0025BB91F2|nr:HAD family phosphatase [Bifidobacterium sp.]MCI1635346.1 HAD family phosphatase [Bifidobacterium sp.]